MANPLKVLAELSASSGVAISGSAGLTVQQGGVVVSDGNIVASNSQITGSKLKITSGASVFGNITLGDTSSVVTVDSPLKLGWGTIQAPNGATAISLSDVNATVSGSLTVTGNEIKSSGGTTAITLNGADVTLAGNLTVRGTTTTVDSTTVTIKDLNLNLGTGSTDLAELDGGGVDLGTSANVQWRYKNIPAAWTANTNINVASEKSYKLNAVEALKGQTIAGAIDAVTLTSGSTSGVVAVGNANGQVFAALSGGLVIGLADQVKFGPNALFGEGLLYISGSDPANQAVDVNTVLRVSASTDSYNYLSPSSNKLNVEASLKALDTQIYNVATVPGITPTKYYGVRTVVSGTKQVGSDSIIFTISGSNTEAQGGNTPTGAALTAMSSSSSATLITLMGGMSVDVAVKLVDTNTWTNDLCSVTIGTSSADGAGNYYPRIVVDAPSLASNSLIRLIVVNENESVIQ